MRYLLSHHYSAAPSVATVTLTVVLTVVLTVAAVSPLLAQAQDEVISVASTSELLDAIGSRRVVQLAPGRYLLPEKKEGTRGNHLSWSPWEGLTVAGVSDLEIRGGEGIELLSPSEQSTVVTFKNCARVFITGLRVGHLTEIESCGGGVFVFEACRDMQLEHCVLFGCGVRGLSLHNSKGLVVRETVIEKCTFDIMWLDSSEGLLFENCRFRDNRCWNDFITVNRARDVSFEKCSFQRNQPRTGEDVANYALFSLDDATTVKLVECDIEGNGIGSLVSGAGTLEQQAVDFDGPAAGAVEVDDTLTVDDEKDVVLPPHRTVTVGTAAQFIAAIRSNTDIIVGAVDLSFDDGRAIPVNPVVSLRDNGDGLCIKNVRRLVIRGEEGTRLLSKSEVAAVLTFQGCTDCELSNLVIGHDPPIDACYGPCLVLRKSSQMLVTNCRLFGCGTEGLVTESCRQIRVEDSRIDECTSGISSLDGTQIQFIRTTFENNGAYQGFYITGKSSILFDDCLIRKNRFPRGELFYVDKKAKVTVTNTRIVDNELAGLQSSRSGPLHMSATTIEGNSYQK